MDQQVVDEKKKWVCLLRVRVQQTCVQPSPIHIACKGYTIGKQGVYARRVCVCVGVSF